jgi:hypothetical protein
VTKDFNVVRAADVKPRGEDKPAWLMEGLWGAGAVGVIGGAPKCGKTWLALELAVAVASGRPCLGRYAVPTPGIALVYTAEDSPEQDRERLENLARARGVDFATLEVRLIVEPQIRIDRPDDVARLRATLELHRPKLLVLDPYVRLQRVDENKATEVSAVLSTLRTLSRGFQVAIALIHHARKNSGDELGGGLRGSSDFHAWGDSNLYVRRRGEGIVLSIEHRAAASPPPTSLALVTDDGPVRLEIRELPSAPEEAPLAGRIIQALEERGPRLKEDLRDALRVRNQHLAEALRDLEASGRVMRTPAGWAIRRNGKPERSGGPDP